MNNFSLDPRIAESSLELGALALSDARINNDSRFPWIILIPRREGLVGLHDLAADDLQLMTQEIRDMSNMLLDVYSPDRINVGALGNIVPQLHVHVIARFEADDAWPGPVWGAGSPDAYDAQSPELEKIRNAFETYQSAR
ncbi:MAG: HIT domain-containing protein [Rhodospirillaceae bacterium]|jgi:diadenosine tetraphosphate (Ap4A) HIT family hydrolase|nr:HIT domain-containing protein [Rhodospirillaceae bacterium]MBT4219368.1 HIT domain-containing protein [Rhodospirillaceae bacterium]MBT4463821.1 HIT domain-containing protein [Rhodospirillaceae bacterium]MBT7355274.1 HIT domain-containing protein [Rhodospirillaceae bacterium]